MKSQVEISSSVTLLEDENILIIYKKKHEESESASNFTKKEIIRYKHQKGIF